METEQNIAFSLIKLADGNRVLRITEASSGISVQREIDRDEPLVAQKRQLVALLKRTQPEDSLEVPALTAEQKDLWRLLKEIETSKYRLGDWYLGALYAISNSHNPDRFAQAAESLRELLEKIPSVITGDTSGLRRERIARNFTATDPLWTALPPNFRDANIDVLVGVGKELENFAHHGSPEGKRPFQKVLIDFEDSLRRIFAPVTAEHQAEIRRIIARRPDENDVQHLLELIRNRGANFSFFFKHVNDPFWLTPLRRAGFFRVAPGVLKASGGGLTFPLWWPALYLVKAAREAPAEVVAILLEMEKSDNPRVLQKIAEIGTAMPDPAIALPLEPLIRNYIEQPYSLGFQDVTQLTTHWSALGGGALLAALRIVRQLIRFRSSSATESPEGEEDPLPTIGSSEPSPKLPDWEYQRVLKDALPPLMQSAPTETARMLVGTVTEMMAMSRPSRAHDDWRDFSEVWCPRLDRQSRRHFDSRGGLITALTRTCERALDITLSDRTHLQDFDDFLRHQRWLVFDRVRYHLYANRLDATKDWIRAAILQQADYADAAYGFEFQRMVRLACEHFGEELLTRDEATKIFDAILSGPDKKGYQEYWGEHFSEENFGARQRRFYVEQLTPFRSILFGKYKEVFESITTEALVRLTDDDYQRYGTGESKTGGSRGPKQTDELLQLSDDDLVHFLNEWEDAHTDKQHWWIDVDFRGLAREFSQAIQRCPERFLSWEGRWNTLQRPIYLAAAVETATTRLKEGYRDELSRWLRVADWIAQQRDVTAPPEKKSSATSRDYSNWDCARRAVVDFVGTCVGEEVNIDVAWRTKLFELLRSAAITHDPFLERDDLTARTRDFLFEAINVLAGALWITSWTTVGGCGDN